MGMYGHLKRVCTESWPGEKFLAAPGNWTCVSGMPVQHYQLSYIPTLNFLTLLLQPLFCLFVLLQECNIACLPVAFSLYLLICLLFFLLYKDTHILMCALLLGFVLICLLFVTIEFFFNAYLVCFRIELTFKNSTKKQVHQISFCNLFWSRLMMLTLSLSKKRVPSGSILRLKGMQISRGFVLLENQ